MKKIIDVEKLTDKKYLNLFELVYETEKGEKRYEIASRKTIPDVVSKTNKPDAVRIIPYFYDKNKNLKVVLIREFRYPINDYVYAVPAGLIDEGENPKQAVERELKEEIGARVIKINQTEKASYTSVGMSDESIVCFEAEVEIDSKQNLDEFEEIEVKIVSLATLKKMLDKENFCLQSRLQLRTFLYKNK